MWTAFFISFTYTHVKSVNTLGLSKHRKRNWLKNKVNNNRCLRSMYKRYLKEHWSTYKWIEAERENGEGYKQFIKRNTYLVMLYINNKIKSDDVTCPCYNLLNTSDFINCSFLLPSYCYFIYLFIFVHLLRVALVTFSIDRHNSLFPFVSMSERRGKR